MLLTLFRAIAFAFDADCFFRLRRCFTLYFRFLLLIFADDDYFRLRLPPDDAIFDADAFRDAC